MGISAEYSPYSDGTWDRSGIKWWTGQRLFITGYANVKVVLQVGEYLKNHETRQVSIYFYVCKACILL